MKNLMFNQKVIKIVLSLLLFANVSFSQVIFAEEKQTEEVIVKVDGLVCDFCSRSLEKVFTKKEQVANIEVDLDASQVTLSIKKGMTLDDKVITQLITDSGYSVTKIIRDK